MKTIVQHLQEHPLCKDHLCEYVLLALSLGATAAVMLGFALALG